jgi:ATP synthase F1 complex assembly factor 2
LSRLEEDFQAEEWGKVEAGHDLDEVDIRSRIYAPSLFVRLLQMQ